MTTPKTTPEQMATVTRMINAPAGGWIRTKTLKATYLGVPCDGVAIQLESPKLRIWGLVLPDGSFHKPKPGRKTIDASDVVYKL